MSGDTIEAVLADLSSSLTAISAAADQHGDELVRAFEFLVKVFNFMCGSRFTNEKLVNVQQIIVQNGLHVSANRFTAQFITDHRIVRAITKIAERLATHPEYYTLEDACIARSGFEFLRLDLADAFIVYTGDLSIPDAQKNWLACVTCFRKYTDKFFDAKTVRAFDDALKFFIRCKREDGEHLETNHHSSERLAPHSHWWWREASKKV